MGGGSVTLTLLTVVIPKDPCPPIIGSNRANSPNHLKTHHPQSPELRTASGSRSRGDDGWSFRASATLKCRARGPFFIILEVADHIDANNDTFTRPGAWLLGLSLRVLTSVLEIRRRRPMPAVDDVHCRLAHAGNKNVDQPHGDERQDAECSSSDKTADAASQAAPSSSQPQWVTDYNKTPSASPSDLSSRREAASLMRDALIEPKRDA